MSIVSSGQTLPGALVSSGALLTVLSGGSVVSATIQSGGVEVISAGGSDSASTIDAGGEAVVLSGGSATGDTVASGGLLFLLSGATTAGIVVQSGGTVASAGVLLEGPFGGVESALVGSASGMTVSSGTNVEITSGGSAISTDVLAGGEVTVDAGGIAVGTTPNGGNLYVAPGGFASATSVGPYGYLEIETGGSASIADVSYAGLIYVQSGATVGGLSLVGNLARVEIAAGGTVTGAVTFAPNTTFAVVQIDGTVMPGSVISGLDGIDSLYLRDVPFDPHGSVSYGAGTLTVTEGGIAYALNVAPMPDYASGQFLLHSGVIGLLPTFGANSGTSIVFQGPSSREVASGQTSSGLAIPGNAWILVDAGGTAVSAVLSGSGAPLTYVGSPIDGGTLDLNTVLAPQGQGENSGTMRAVTIDAGGNVINDGLITSAIVADGGVLFSLGTIEGSTIMHSAIELDLGVVSNVVIDGGLEGLVFTGIAVSAVVMSGGEQVVGGYLSADGRVAEVSGGTASATTIEAGGSMFVNSSGTAIAPEITSGGTLVVNAGATVSGDIGFLGTGGRLVLGGASAGGLTLSGFAAGDAIDLRDIAPGGSPAATLSGGVLTVSAGGGVTTLALAGNVAGLRLTASGDAGSGTLIEAACYVAGTRIATTRGEVPVEALAPGDRVCTQEGRTRPVRWLGWRHVDCARHPHPERVWPVRIRADAFAPGRPRRDLLLSPDHAVFVDGLLIPVRCLVNGATIAPAPVDRVAYYHVELDRHDVILAEGLPAESYLDTGNRAAFANGGGAVALHPDFSRAVWQRDACAQLVMEGAALAAVRQRLLARAAMLGRRLTREPMLALAVDGRAVVAERAGRWWSVRLAADAAFLRLRSRVWTPAETDPDPSTDPRRLGVAVGALRRDGADLALDDPALAAGWHAPEPGWRWTNGDAAIRVAGARRIGFAVAIVGHYWQTNTAALRQVPVKRGARFSANAARPSR